LNSEISQNTLNAPANSHENRVKGPDYFRTAATLQNCAHVEMPLKMPRALAIAKGLNTGILEQNEEFDA